MSNFHFQRFRILVDRHGFDPRVAYLVLPLHDSAILETFAKFAQGHDKHFNSVIENHVSAYIEKGTMPPAAIVGPVLNIAEDVAAGREVTLRAGDYIALQTFVRSQGSQK